MDFIRKHKYIFAFVSSMLLEFWFSMCAWSANHDNYTVAILANLTYPFISMLPMVLLVEEQGLKNKLKIASFNGLGYTFGTILFLYFLKERISQ
jgi:hypothetical protein